jgi:GNAT superfamily N-acetyltransferase
MQPEHRAQHRRDERIATAGGRLLKSRPRRPAPVGAIEPPRGAAAIAPMHTVPPQRTDMASYLVRDAVVEFNLRLAEESECIRLDPETVRAGVQAALADRQKARYFLACAGPQPVGQLMLTWEWSDWRNGTIWWLQSVYVRRENRGQGVFRQLFEHARTLAQTDPAVVGLRLYVEDGNQRAKDVYARLGLERAGYTVMEDIWRSGTVA